MTNSPIRETYTNVVREAEVDGGWSGQLRVVVGKGISDEELVFVDSDLLGPRRLVFTPQEAEATAAVMLDVVAAAAATTSFGCGPVGDDVDAVCGLLDLMEQFADNDQRARYLLSSNWLRDRGAAAAARLRGLSTVESTL